MKALSTPAQQRYQQDDGSVPGTDGAGKGSLVAKVYGDGGTAASRNASPGHADPGSAASPGQEMGQVIQMSPASAASPPAPAAVDAPGQAAQGEEEKPGFWNRLGSGIWGGIKKGGALLWQGATGVYRAGQSVVHGAADIATRGTRALGEGAEWLGDKLGADNEGASGWLGKGVRGIGTGLQSGSTAVRDTLGLDQDGNDFTGHIDIPEDNKEHTQQYSELGLPMTEDAWAMQDAIDGGKLRDTYDRTLLSALQRGGVLERLVKEGKISPDRIPESFDEMDADQFNALIASIRSELGSGRAFLDSLEPEERESFQEQVIHSYMQRAKNDEHAAFMLELMPTDTTDIPGQMLESTGDALIRGQGANDFKVGELVGRIRQGAVTMSERLQAQGDNVYALPVPYANTVPNIVGRTGKPADGADHLHNYLQHLGPEMKTVTTGYSQGGAAVLDYLDRYGDQDGLDYALALAPMGGADQHGADGVFSGELNGVNTLSIMNQADPAKDLHGDYLVDLIDPMWTFVDDKRQAKRGLDGQLHSGFYGDDAHALPPGSDPRAAMAAGTMGYPTAYVSPMLDDLFSDRAKGQPYQRRGNWDYDLRNELVYNGQDGKFDPSKTKRDGRAVADQYLPQ